MKTWLYQTGQQVCLGGISWLSIDAGGPSSWWVGGVRLNLLHLWKVCNAAGSEPNSSFFWANFSPPSSRALLTRMGANIQTTNKTFRINQENLNFHQQKGLRVTRKVSGPELVFLHFAVTM